MYTAFDPKHVLFMSTLNDFLEQVRLLHDAEEFLFVHLAITIAVRLIDHLLELLVRHPLPELLCDTLQVLERDLPCLVVIEETECLEYLILRITVEDLLRHHGHELRKLDCARPIIVDILDLLLLLLGELLLLAAPAAETTSQRHRRTRLF